MWPAAAHEEKDSVSALFLMMLFKFKRRDAARRVPAFFSCCSKFQ
jgi:hypothetical protein